MALWRKVIAPLFCCVLFIIAFVFLKKGWILVNDSFPGPGYGLLIFLIPGVVTALIFRESAIFSSFVGAIVAMPICYVLRWVYFARIRPPVQEFAYAGSAIFWCVLGAMLVLLWLTAYRQLHEH